MQTLTTQTMPHVAIVIVNWNGADDTLECLASLAEDHYPRKSVVLVDNGSHDGSVAKIRASHPWVQIVESDRNLGFTGGNNLALSHPAVATADYVYFLNNDTVCTPDALSTLLEEMERHPSFGVVTPSIYYFDAPDQPWFTGSSMDPLYERVVHNNNLEHAEPGGVIEIPWASGCAMLVRGYLLRRLKGFDDRYFLIWEDVDLSLRVRELGYSVGVVPGARICHKVSRSFERSLTGEYYHLRNHLLLLRIHGKSRVTSTMSRVVISHLRRAVRQTLKGQDTRQPAGLLSMCFAAVADHLRYRYGRRGASPSSLSEASGA